MPTTLAQKLQIRSGHQMVVLNVPAGYHQTLAVELNDNIVSTANVGAVDVVLLFVNSLDEVERLAIDAVKRDVLLWIAYPKGTSKVKTDINRDRLWPVIEPIGWRPVWQIALDQIWSAMRFRPADQISSNVHDRER